MRDRRSDPRRNYPTTVHYSSSKEDYTGTIKDISAGGLFINTPLPLNVGTRIALCFNVPKCRTLVEGRIVRKEKGGMGVHFQNIKGAAPNLFEIS